MPELPEVETVRRGLHDRIIGRRIDSVTLGRLRSVRRYAEPQALVDELVGVRIERTGRHGKYLLVHMDAGIVLVIHLRMSGQLLHVAPGADLPVALHTHVRFGLSDGAEVRFLDPRTFGELFVTTPDLPELAHLGPDAFDAVSTPAELAVRMAGRRAPLKSVLLDQRVVAGVGSIYADELCFRAGVRPTRPASGLRPIEVARIHSSMKSVLAEAVAAGGSTLGDGQYVGVDGKAGTYALDHRVHALGGLPCSVCGTTIRSGIIGQRSAYWCIRCQR